MKPEKIGMAILLVLFALLNVSVAGDARAGDARAGDARVIIRSTCFDAKGEPCSPEVAEKMRQQAPLIQQISPGVPTAKRIPQPECTSVDPPSPSPCRLPKWYADTLPRLTPFQPEASSKVFRCDSPQGVQYQETPCGAGAVQRHTEISTPTAPGNGSVTGAGSASESDRLAAKDAEERRQTSMHRAATDCVSYFSRLVPQMGAPIALGWYEGMRQNEPVIIVRTVGYARIGPSNTLEKVEQDIACVVRGPLLLIDQPATLPIISAYKSTGKAL